MYRASDPLEQRLAHFRDLERLGEQITELAAHLDAGAYRFLVLLEAFDHEGGFGLQAHASGDLIFSLPNGTPIPDSAHGRSRGNVW